MRDGVHCQAINQWNCSWNCMPMIAYTLGDQTQGVVVVTF